MFVLKMQNILDDRCMRVPVCRAETEEALVNLVKENLCTPYEDPLPADWKGPPLAAGVTGIKKYFKRGSALEWCQYLSNFDMRIEPVGSEEDWVQAARLQWKQQVGALPDVSA